MNRGEIITPASKEQCGFLFQKMEEAGYEWNIESKQLLNEPEPMNISEKTIVPMTCPKEELTELEKAIYELIYDYIVSRKTLIKGTELKERAAKLISLARKQIVEEIDVDDVLKKWNWANINDGTWYVSFYRKGIRDTLEKIKGK